MTFAINTGKTVVSGSGDDERLTFSDAVRPLLSADETSTGTPPARTMTSPAITVESGRDAGAARTESGPSDNSAAPIGCSESVIVTGSAGAGGSSAAGMVNQPAPSGRPSAQPSQTTTSYRTPGRLSRSTVSAGFVSSDCSRKKLPPVSSRTWIGSARLVVSRGRVAGAATSDGAGRARQPMAGRASAAMTESMNAICNARRRWRRKRASASRAGSSGLVRRQRYRFATGRRGRGARRRATSSNSAMSGSHATA